MTHDHWRLGALALALLAAAAPADELLLRNGNRIEGVVETDGDEFVIRDGASAMRIPRHEVREIVRKPTLEQRYENLRLVTPEDNLEEQLSLARWCRQNKLPKQARAHFEKAVALDPNNHEARRGAGYQLYQGKWLTHDEAQRARGYELYKGKWLPKPEAERLRAADELAAARDAARKAVRAIIEQAGRLEKGEDTKELAARLAALDGPGVTSQILLFANDDSLPVRETVLRAAIQRDAPDKLSFLLKRFRLEPTPRLQNLAARALKEWQPRDDVTPKVLEIAIQAPLKKTRDRAGGLLRDLGDKRIIPILIGQVDYCPVPEQEQRRPDKAQANGVTTSQDVRPRKPYYPAHRLLTFLTNQQFRHDQKPLWEDWWRRHADDFDLRHPPAAEEVPKDDLRLKKAELERLLEEAAAAKEKAAAEAKRGDKERDKENDKERKDKP